MESYPRNYPRADISPAQKAKIILSESPKESSEKEKNKEKVYKYLIKDRSPMYPNYSLLGHGFKPFGLNYGAYNYPFY